MKSPVAHCLFDLNSTVGQKILKSLGQKNQINQFHEKKIQKSIFCHLKNGQKSIFELGKSLKLTKMQFHELFLFHEIDCWQFFPVQKLIFGHF